MSMGRDVGWQVRFERHFEPTTRLLVATEGILTARLAADPLLSGFATVVLDEFHERTIHADLALAFLKQALRARPDLALVVMSATLGSGAERVSAYLEGCPIYEVTGRPYAVEIVHRAGAGVGEVVRERLQARRGHLLCFLPGAAEIRAAARDLSGLDVTVLPLYGALDAREQDEALAPSSARKVVLATNIAETSLTVEGVTDVVDSGLHKVLRFDAAKGIDRLEAERISEDSAAQRAGRAGRTGPGTVFRLWDPRDKLRPRREPDVARIDLAGPLLDVMAWGGDLAAFEWYEAPAEERLANALRLLDALGATRDGHVTPLGLTLRRFPLHPRLARVLLDAGGGPRAAAACVILQERPLGLSDGATTDSDVVSSADRLERAPFGVRQAAREIEAMARRLIGPPPAAIDDVTLRRALLAGYPDRLARRRVAGSPRLVLASGHGAMLGRESGVRGGEFLLGLDVVAGPAGPGSEAIVRMASVVEPDWIPPTGREVAHRLDPDGGCVRAFETLTHAGLVLSERPIAPDPATAAEILCAELGKRGLGADSASVVNRMRFAALPVDVDAAVRRACEGETCLDDVDVANALGAAAGPQLERLAPIQLPLPSGRSVRLEYRDDGAVVAAVKLQELFGLAETPRLGPRQVPVTLSLLAPNGRPVQTTRDLRGFWERTYPEVRRELRGRYPRHPWPEDPWTATPTHRARPRKGGSRV